MGSHAEMKLENPWKVEVFSPGLQGAEVQPSPHSTYLTSVWGHHPHKELLEGRVGGQWAAESSVSPVLQPSTS